MQLNSAVSPRRLPQRFRFLVFPRLDSLRAENSWLCSDQSGFSTSRAWRHTPTQTSSIPGALLKAAARQFWLSDNGVVYHALQHQRHPQATVVAIKYPRRQPQALPVGPCLTERVPRSTAITSSSRAPKTAPCSAGHSALTVPPHKILVNNSTSGSAAYKGLAIGTVSGSVYAYGTDFTLGRIDVFPGNGGPSLSGNFTDPNLPAGYGPFNIQNLGGKLYVTYAQQSGGLDEVDGAGLGFVDVYDLSGNFLQRSGQQRRPQCPLGLGPRSRHLRRSWRRSAGSAISAMV